MMKLFTDNPGSLRLSMFSRCLQTAGVRPWCLPAVLQAFDDNSGVQKPNNNNYETTKPYFQCALN